MIVRARVVVTMDGPPVANGAVAISGNRIVEVGTFPEISRSRSQEKILDLGEQALLPGLINAHCHLDYTCLREKIPRQKSFTDWIRAINAAKAKLTAEDYVASTNEGFAEAKRFGTTTIANLTAFPDLVSKIESPIRTWWFAELIDVQDPSRASEIVDHAVAHLKSQEHWGLAPHAPFTASPGLYRRCEEIARHENILLTTHLAESGEEMRMFRDADGPLYEFLKEIGRPMKDCGRRTPLDIFLEDQRAIEGDRPYLCVHLNELTSNDFDLLQESAKSSSIAHCPRSHNYFGHSPFQFEKLRDAGFNICLATDSLASNDDLSLFAEMRAFQKKFPGVSPEEILRMVTTNPARALRREKELGKIRRGFIADLVAVPIEKPDAVLDEIIAFERGIVWSMLGGRVLA